MPPKTLHDLPAEVLSEITSYVFNFSPASRRIRGYGIHISAESSTKRHRLSILLTCRRLHAIAAPILYSQSLFTFSHDTTLKSFLTNLSPATLALLRHVRIWPGSPAYTFWDYSIDEERDLTGITTWTQSISVLPRTLQTLELEIGQDGYLPFFTEQGTHHLMLRALRRLSGLRRLSINCRRGHLHFDVFFRGLPRESNSNPATSSSPTPLFPSLQELSLTARLVQDPVFLAAVLSSRNLPHLQSLHLRNGWDDRTNSSQILSAEALRQVAPLNRFSWTIYDDKNHEWNSHMSPLQPLRGEFTHSHLAALAERHCGALRDLSVTLDGTQLQSADIWEFLCKMSKLERLELYLPRNCLSLFALMDSSDDNFLPLLKHLDLTVLVEKHLVSVSDHVLEFPLPRLSKRVRTVLLHLAIEFEFGAIDEYPELDELVDGWVQEAVTCAHVDTCSCPTTPPGWWDLCLVENDGGPAMYTVWFDTSKKRWMKEAESHVIDMPSQPSSNEEAQADEGFLTATP